MPTPNISKASAAIAFAYGDMMIDRLQPLHNCDLQGCTSQLKGLGLVRMKYYAQARLCSVVKQQMFEGRIYCADGKFSVPALIEWLRHFEQDYALINDFDSSKGDSQTIGFTEDQKIDYAFWDAARTMQSWKYIG